MIWIFNLERASAGSCDNYDDLFHYFSELEKSIPLVNHQKQNATKNVSASDNDVAKKQWCIDFGKSHNYIIVETPCPTPKVKQTHWASPIYSSDSEDLFERVD